MPRQSNGADIQPANTAAVGGNTISSVAFNTLITDIYTEITNSLDRAGRSAMTAALPMGGQKITGMADPTNATDGANKEYVDALVAAFFSTGDFKTTLKIVADTGWVLCDDGTIGSATSGASTRANADTQNLFNLLFNNTVDAYAPILTSGGGATTRAAQVSANAAWAANCRMSLTRMLGRALGFASGGAGLTVRGLGQFMGEENHQLIVAELPPYTPSGTIVTNTTTTVALAPSASSGGVLPAAGNSTPIGNAASVASVSTSTFTGTAQGGTSTAHNTMQPTVFVNVMIKL